MSLKDAAKVLGISYRQARRICKRFIDEGDAGLVKEGPWQKRRKRSAYRLRRIPKDHFGELVQMDGSHHRWFEERGEESCLMNMVDDTTTTTMSLMAS